MGLFLVDRFEVEFGDVDLQVHALGKQRHRRQEAVAGGQVRMFKAIGERGHEVRHVGICKVQGASLASCAPSGAMRAGLGDQGLAGKDAIGRWDAGETDRDLSCAIT